MPVQKKILDLTGSQYLVQKVKSAINDVDSSLSTHIADNDIHVTTADKSTWNTVTSKANDSDVVHKGGNETVAGFKQFDNIRVTNSIKAINLDSITTDLNNCYSDFTTYGESKSGNIQYYYCNTDAGTANISNLPEAKAFFLTSITTRLISNSLYVKQILINSNSKTFTRYCNNSTWSSWVNETDSEYVHKSGNETISGEKTFNDLQIVGYGTQYKGARNAYILPEFSAGYSGLAITTLGFPQTLKIGNFVLDANNKPSLDTSKGYIQIATGENNNVNTCVLEPRNSTYSSLGTSVNRWSKIYGTEYYYGSNNVEFSQKFVTTDTNQTISGNKTFFDVPISFKSSTAELGVTGGNTNITFLDKNNKNLSGLTLGNYASSKLSYVRFSIFDKDTNDNEIQDSLEYAYVSNNTNAYLRVFRDNFCTLGSSSNRWKSVYALNYYYGSNNVEFSTKFVTTDTAQTISGAKTFSSDLTVANTDTTANTPNLTLKNYKADRGTTDTAVQTISFSDKNAKALTIIESRRISNGNTATNIFTYNTDDSNNTVSGGIAIIKSKTDTNFAPNADNAVTCGRALAKWSDVQTYQVNGVEPSSLSLPSGNASNFIDISSYFDNTVSTNSYTASANGWIYLRLGDISSCQATVYDANNNKMWGQSTTGSVEQITIPILKGQTLITQWATGSTVTVATARFIPCLGNV